MKVTRVVNKKPRSICDGCGALEWEELIEIEDADGYTTLLCDECSLELYNGLAVVLTPVQKIEGH